MSIPVIAIFDVGKTNKKLFLFNEQYELVFERTARFIETVDEDGFPCDNLDSLRLSVFDSLREVFRQPKYEVKAINFSTYGASLVYIDERGNPLTPLYNYLKPLPEEIHDKFYAEYGEEEIIALQTASPTLGSLNSGMQLYRLKYQQPEIFERMHCALHLPQYMSFLISGQLYSDMTSIGCHTQLWDFVKKDYHSWVCKERLNEKLAPIVAYNQIYTPSFPGSGYVVGAGFHDSSAALIPYLMSFHQPFVLLSTGTWCISLNPFNDAPLTVEELKQDCLCYLQYMGSPVKASRLFAGHEHELQSKRIAAHFGVSTARFRSMPYNRVLHQQLLKRYDGEMVVDKVGLERFSKRDLNDFTSSEEAYHQLMMDLVAAQYEATKLVINDAGKATRLFVDGGFGKNAIYMALLADAFPAMEVYAASMAQGTAMGAALAIHEAWNSHDLPQDIIELKYYTANTVPS
ncbi:FGGY-family carbohydrate kinase [Olivibacter sitiensis]|uniref:FGGY-family carbohydrate kinase n=1 Tax=Olivibacter sitiensis TaxID=376470 RepID=UPI0003FF787D|nr:FGGY family carbohydrate kinase [Olivibacter sitiensis]